MNSSVVIARGGVCFFSLLWLLAGEVFVDSLTSGRSFLSSERDADTDGQFGGTLVWGDGLLEI